MVRRRCPRWPKPCAPRLARAHNRLAPRVALRARPRRAPVAIGLLLAELAERVDVRVMVWAGSPVPLFHPTRKDVEAEVRS